MDDEKIINIINTYDGADIPEELRNVCIDYFLNNDDDSSSDISDSANETLAASLEDDVQPQNNVLQLNIEDIPVLQDEDVIDNLENFILPVEEVEEFHPDEEPIPVIGDIQDDDEFIPVWEPVEYDQRTSEDDANIRAVFVTGCCPKKCSGKFTLDELLTFNLESRSMDYYIDGSNLLDTVILGEIRAMCRTHDSIKTGYGSVVKERQRFRMLYTMRGESICEKLFLLTHAIKVKRFKRLLKIYKTSGFVQPVHGNVKRTPKKVCSYETVEKVVSFIRNYAEESALFMPGRLANQFNIVKLLPSSDNKIGLYRKYKQICESSNVRAVGKSLFKEIWLTFCPDVVIMKPKSDLCALCQKNYTSHANLRGMSEEEKESFFEKCREHLQKVKVEREAYKDTIKSTVDNLDINNLKISDKGLPIPNSYEGAVHYSFDFAQQIHIPFDSMQPGPIYFLTPFKVGLFGIMNDTLKVQHNYLIPESCQVSKGANAIVSFLDHYLKNHALGEHTLLLHADNCVAQNKNNIVMSYLNWRVLNGLNNSIKLYFLPVGHTKFACDWAFGLFKQKVRVEKASCLADVARIVHDSTPVSKVNRPILTGLENGDVLVPIHDWQTFFSSKNWHIIPNITKYNHFSFNSTDKGKVMLQKITGGTVTVAVISGPEPVVDVPGTIKPPGLTHKRKAYLYEKIRPYCPDKDQDLLCPNPGPLEEEEVDQPSTSKVTPGKRKRGSKLKNVPKPTTSKEETKKKK